MALSKKVKMSVPTSQLILLLGALAALAPMSIDMYLPAFPAIEKSLHTTPAMLSGTLASFFAGLCSGQLLYGPLSDRIGRKLPLLLGVAIYVLASLACWWAPSIEVLLVMRFFQAFGACAGIVVGRALVRDLFDPAEVPRVFSLVMLTMGVAPIIAPIVGQVLADWTGWRGLFGFMASFAVWVGLAVGRLLPSDFANRTRVLEPPLWCKFASVLADRRFLAFTLSGTFIQGGLYAYLSGSSTLFIGQLGFSPKAYSLLFGLNAAGLIFSSQWNVRLLRQYSSQRVLEGALWVACLSAIVLASLGLSGKGGLLVTVPLFVFISSLGFVFPNSTAGALAGQGHQAGTASALIGFLQYGGGAVASAAVGALQSVTSAPVQITIGMCGVLSIVTYYRLVGSALRSPATGRNEVC